MGVFFIVMSVFWGVPVFNSETTVETTVILCSQDDPGMPQRTKVFLGGMAFGESKC